MEAPDLTTLNELARLRAQVEYLEQQTATLVPPPPPPPVAMATPTVNVSILNTAASSKHPPPAPPPSTRVAEGVDLAPEDQGLFESSEFAVL